MKVVKVGAALGDELLTNADGEWKVGHTVAVQVTDLPPAYVKEDHSSAIGLNINSRPGADLSLNLLDGCVQRHSHFEIRSEAVGAVYDRPRSRDLLYCGRP